jgi:hypothetical protein
MTLNPQNFGLYALVTCGCGAILPILVLFTSERPDEFFGNSFIMIMLIAFQAVGLLLGVLGWKTGTGKLGIGISVLMIFFIFFLSLNSKIPPPQKDNFEELKTKPRRR